MAAEEVGLGNPAIMEKIFKDVKYYVIGTLNDSVWTR